MLRAPIGKKNVGICEMDTDSFGTSDFSRRLSLMFYYPTDEKGEEYPYKDAAYQREKSSDKVDNGVKTYCYANVSISKEKEKYPIIIYNHGLMGFQMESTVLCADLASSGYIVVSVGHPYGSGAITYADGTIFTPNDSFEIDRHNLTPLGELWHEDICYAIGYLDRINTGDVECMFSRKMDLTQGVNLLGVSFGGCCGVDIALSGEKIRCAINLEGGLFIELTPVYTDRPILVMCSPFNRRAHAKLAELGCNNIKVSKIKKISHWEFSDGIYLSERGQNNHDFADLISVNRARMCLDFLEYTP